MKTNKKSNIKAFIRIITSVVIPILNIIIGSYLVGQINIVSNKQIKQYNDLTDAVMQYQNNINQLDSTTVQGDVVNNNSAIVDERMSINTLLQEAQSAYFAKDYKRMAEIYCIDKLQNDSVAQNNVGFMYANGLYYPVNVEQADYYYEKAMAQNNIKAYENKLALHMRTKQEDRIQLLQQGYQLRDEKLLIFMRKYYENNEIENYRTLDKWILNFLYDASYEEQNNTLENFYEWNYEGRVYLDYSPEDIKGLIAYVWVDDCNSVDGTIHTYQKYKSLCNYIDILDESFERQK